MEVRLPSLMIQFSEKQLKSLKFLDEQLFDTWSIWHSFPHL